MILLILVSGCIKKDVDIKALNEIVEDQETEGWEPVTTNETKPKNLDFSIHTIDYFGDVPYYPYYNLIDYILPIKPIYDRITGEKVSANYSSYGIVCEEYYIPFGSPVNVDIMGAVFENKTSGITEFCFESNAEVVGLTVNGKYIDVSFTEDECSKIITEDEEKYYIDLNYTKNTCVDL